MICKTVNIKKNMPLVSQAMTQLGNEIWLAKYARCHALKVIHGYGSTGQGGAIKTACLKLCADRKRTGVIRHFVRGEDFTPFWQTKRRHHHHFILKPEKQKALLFGELFLLIDFYSAVSSCGSSAGLQRISFIFVSSRDAV